MCIDLGVIPQFKTGLIRVTSINDHKVPSFSDISLEHMISYGWISALIVDTDTCKNIERQSHKDELITKCVDKSL